MISKLDWQFVVNKFDSPYLWPFATFNLGLANNLGKYILDMKANFFLLVYKKFFCFKSGDFWATLQ